MATVRATVFENVTPGSRFEEYRKGDQLVLVGTFEVGGDSIEAALEDLFWVGNKQGPDSAGRRWPLDRRSMSVGDLVVVEGETYAVDIVGFKAV